MRFEIACLGKARLREEPPGRLQSPHHAFLGQMALMLLVAISINACSRSPVSPSVPAPMSPPSPAFTPTPDYSNPEVTVVADGLLGPIGVEELPGGGILVAEEGTGQKD